MTPFTVVWSETAKQMLAAIKDKRIQRDIYTRASKLSVDPEKQGKALKAELIGYRSIRVVGQRYRIVYKVNNFNVLVKIITTGIRKENDKKDVYNLTKQIVSSDK